MQIKILNNWFGKFIFVSEIKRQTLANANWRIVHFWDIFGKKIIKILKLNNNK